MSQPTEAKLRVSGVYKVFGEDPDKAMEMVAQGLGKSEIFEKTGQTLGVVNASFEVNEGEIFVIMGLSGSGKSTLVRLLNRLIEPTVGEIVVNGKDIAKLNAEQLREVRRRTMSMVFQSFALLPHLTVLANTAFGLELSGVDQATREERARNALAQVGLDAYSDSYPDELSGGMQQRVGLARALANDPEILLMDEAFSALDPLIRTEMQDELLKLQSNSSRTIIFISHDLDEAMRIGDRIAIMEGGRVVQVGTPDEILRNPADDYVRAFFRGVDISTVLSARDVASRQQTTVIERQGTGVRAALKRLHDHDRECGYVVGKDLKFIGVVTLDSLKAQRDQDGPLNDAVIQDVPSIHVDTNLNELLGTVAEAPYGLPVVDDDGRYTGVITRAALLNTLDRESEAADGGDDHG
ncbi:MAG: glycine betaine/L-proline ABC transporter ATP-binding protein ProV [Gammaproteobacteria bacterium]